MSRARGPHSPSVVHADVRSVTCALPSGHVVGDPLEVGHAVQAAGHHAELLVAEPQDREVGAEAAARRQQRRVDDAPDRYVHLAHRDLLHGRERAGAGDVEDAERAQVEHRRAVAHREVLGVDDRRPPARVPLRRPAVDAVLVDQLRVRLVPVRALPSGRLEEDRAERLLAGVERRQPDVAIRRPLLAGMDDPVGLVEPLGGPRAHVRVRLLAVVEARDVRATGGRSPTRRRSSTPRPPGRRPVPP